MILIGMFTSTKGIHMDDKAFREARDKAAQIAGQLEQAWVEVRDQAVAQLHQLNQVGYVPTQNDQALMKWCANIVFWEITLRALTRGIENEEQRRAEERGEQSPEL